MRYKIPIIFGVLIGILVLILTGAYFLTQTEYFRNLVKRKTEEIVSSSTGQKLTIGSVEGTFFYSIRLKDVSFEVEGEGFVTVDEAELVYSIPAMLNSTFLLGRNVLVDSITLSGVDVRLIKYADGTWNFGKIGEKKEKEGDKEKESTGPPQWNITAPDVELDGIKLTLDDRESGKVSEYLLNKTELSVRLGNIYEKIEANIKNADFDAVSEGITVRGLSTKALYSPDAAEVENLKVTVNGAEINGSVKAEDLQNTPDFTLDIAAKGYEIEDVGTVSLEAKGKGGYAGPGDIRADLSVVVPESELYGEKVSARLDSIKMSGTKIDLGDGKIETGPGQIEISGEADIKRILTKEGANSFNVNLKLKNVKTAEVFTILEEKAGTRPEGINTQLDAVLNSEIKAEGSWVEFGDLKATADIASFGIKGPRAGELRLTGKVDYSKTALGLDLKTALNKLNPGVIMNKSDLNGSVTTDLAVRASIPLEGDIVSGMNGTVKGSIKPSNIYNLDIQRGNIDVSYEREILTARALSIDGDGFKFNVTDGSGGRKGINLGYELEVKDLALISKFAKGTEFAGSLEAKGRVEGEITNPKISIDGDIKGFELNDNIKAETITIKAEGTPDLSNPDLKAEINAETMTVGEREFESLEINADSDDGKAINVDAEITENDDFKYIVHAALSDITGPKKQIEISKLLLDLEDTELENRENISITIAPDSLVLNSFNLYYNDTSALADATIFYDGSVEASVNLKDLSLNDVVKIFDPKAEVEGQLSANVNASGTMTAPQLRAKVNIGNIEYKDFKNDDIDLDVSYLERNLTLKFDITDEGASILQANGSSNVDLNLKELGDNVENAPFNLTVTSSGVDLSPLTTFSAEVEKSSGVLVIDLKASGTLGRPVANGQLSMKDAIFKIKSLRNEFKVESALVEMNGQKGILKELIVHSGSNGTGKFTGNIDIPTMTYDLKGDLQDFLIRPKNVAGRLTGNIDVDGEGSKIALKGDLTVSRARITIPETEERQVEEIKFADEREDEFTVQSGQPTDYFKEDISMNLRVRMRRNNWVRGRGANVELRGDLDINKAYGEDMRIVGNISTVRGTYENFGKLFRIVQGNVSFSGTPDINPFLDIRALYRVSGVEIYINISGTAKKPVVELTSDPPMSETDMVSYIVFGAPSDQIGSSDRASIQGVASGLAGGVAAAQLERMLGSRFKLDVVNIGTGTGGPELEVGKYLTEDLYFAVERETTQSLTDSTTVTQTKVIVEYTIFKNVSINGDIGGENPGVDVFYNFNY